MYEHPDVSEAAAFGVPDARLGELVSTDILVSLWRDAGHCGCSQAIALVIVVCCPSCRDRLQQACCCALFERVGRRGYDHEAISTCTYA